MSITYSGEELLEIAIQIERNGYAFYSQVAQRIGDVSAKKLIMWLAEEEKSHIGRFEEILSRFSQGEMDMQPEELEEYTLYLKALADSRVFSTEIEAKEAALKIKTEKDAIDLAIGFEKDSLLFLSWMKELIRGPDIAVVEALQREEMQHLKKLVGLKGK